MLLQYLAQAAAPVDPTSLGWAAVAVITGAGLCYRFVALPERERAKAAEGELRATNAALIKEVVPALVAANDIQNKTQALLVDLQQRSNGPT